MATTKKQSASARATKKTKSGNTKAAKPEAVKAESGQPTIAHGIGTCSPIAQD